MRKHKGGKEQEEGSMLMTLRKRGCRGKDLNEEWQAMGPVQELEVGPASQLLGEGA
jgi:hypothetical protein